MIQIERIELPVQGIEQIEAEARAQGYDFVETLVSQWKSGENRFQAAGEILCGHSDHGLLVAVGGLTLDPFVPDPRVGRIRRVYVRSAWRNRGIGGALVTALVNEARKHFSSVRLRAENAEAARLYERLGFTPNADRNATHILQLGADGQSFTAR
jgi:GNAT superfamily N-acetyltransferase